MNIDFMTGAICILIYDNISSGWLSTVHEIHDAVGINKNGYIRLLVGHDVHSKALRSCLTPRRSFNEVMIFFKMSRGIASYITWTSYPGFPIA